MVEVNSEIYTQNFPRTLSPKLHSLATTRIKSGGKSQISLSFLSSLGNDIRRKHYMVGIHSTVGKRAKRMPNTTVEITHTMVDNTNVRTKHTSRSVKMFKNGWRSE